MGRLLDDTLIKKKFAPLLESTKHAFQKDVSIVKPKFYQLFLVGIVGNRSIQIYDNARSGISISYKNMEEHIHAI